MSLESRLDALEGWSGVGEKGFVVRTISRHPDGTVSVKKQRHYRSGQLVRVEHWERGEVVRVEEILP
jgi:hypothetical protein